MVRSSPVQSIIIDVDGAMHSGEYYTRDRSVVVHYQGRKKETWFRHDGMSPQSLAGLLLRELVREQHTQ